MIPTLGLKLRANPETFFDTLHGIISHLSSSTIDFSNDNLIMMLPLVMKQLMNAKLQVRQLASSLIGKLALFRNCRGVVVEALACALQKGSGSGIGSGVTLLTTAEHRVGAYLALSTIAKEYKANDTATAASATESSSSTSSTIMINTALEAIATSMTRETGKAKELGITCLIAWMTLSKKAGGAGVSVGFDKAVEYLAQPIMGLDGSSGSSGAGGSGSGSGSGSGNEFRFRLGALFTMTEEYNTAESFVVHLLEKGDEKKIVKGLNTVIDACVKKHGNSNLVAQMDGLIAIHLLLILAKTSMSMTATATAKDDSSILTVLPSSAIKVLQAGAALSIGASSFLYSNAMTDAFSGEKIVQVLLHRVIALYTKLIAKARDAGAPQAACVGIVRLNEQGFSAAAYALACCVAQQSSVADLDDACASTSTSDLEASVKSVVTYAFPLERASDAIVSAMFSRVNELSLELTEKEEMMDEKGEDIDPFGNANSASVRGVSSYLAKTVTDSQNWTEALILSHFGTSTTTTAQQGEECEEEREELEEVCTQIISEMKDGLSMSDVANHVVNSAAAACYQAYDESSVVLSRAVHISTLSLITTFGKLAGAYDEETTDRDDEESKPCIFAWELCVKELAAKLASHLDSAVAQAEALGQDDLGLYSSPVGELYAPVGSSEKESESKTVKSKRGSEEEEWEKQVRKELAQKKDKNDAQSLSLSTENKSKIAEQATERIKIKHVLDWVYSRALASVQALCSADMEVGNAILPTVSASVTSAAISTSEALKLKSKSEESFQTLCRLAECVYEIDEEHAEKMALALMICQKKQDKDESKDQIKVVALPATCEEAAVVISEMDEYGDSLSGNSFAFLFPVVRAALTGQRTTPGCEAALQVLDRHTELISEDRIVAALRKDMSSAVLELLSHDRSIAFKDPSPTETLVNIYTNGKKATATELAPLLSESGALGGKNCRLATMTTFASIITQHPKIVKTNPVVENRILVNCFAKDEIIKAEARRAWKLACGVQAEESELPAPSKIYAIALVPLLSHKDSDIANAAAAAFAFGIEKHPDLTDKSFNRLFNAYIDSYATLRGEGSAQLAAPVPTPAAAAPTLQAKPKKKAAKLDIGTVKKKPMTKTGGSIMSSLTKTAASKKKPTKSSSISSFAPKKKERTLDQDMLIAQFAPTTMIAQKAGEKDSEEKISTRTGVLQVLAALTRSSSDVKLEIATLKLLVGFLMAYGLADLNENVRGAACNALCDTVASESSKDAMDFLLPVLEITLKNGKADKSCLGDLPTDKVLDDTAATDHRKEGVVIALGSAAIHLRDVEDAEKINDTFKMLIATLSTPSKGVQSSVALCLSKLMKKGDMKAQTEKLLEAQVKECLNAQSFASRRGAAYGISAIVKGSGIASLKKYSVVKQLEEACTSGSASAKEGALFAIELLSDRLGLLFEPYVIVLLPALLQSFSDPSDHVRAAAKTSVGLIMSKLSGHGVKLLVPAVLSGLEEDDWRTKQASINMLGSMSQCAPKQLARYE